MAPAHGLTLVILLLAASSLVGYARGEVCVRDRAQWEATSCYTDSVGWPPVQLRVAATTDSPPHYLVLPRADDAEPYPGLTKDCGGELDLFPFCGHANSELPLHDILTLPTYVNRDAIDDQNELVRALARALSTLILNHGAGVPLSMRDKLIIIDTYILFVNPDLNLCGLLDDTLFMSNRTLAPYYYTLTGAQVHHIKLRTEDLVAYNTGACEQCTPKCPRSGPVPLPPITPSPAPPIKGNDPVCPLTQDEWLARSCAGSGPLAVGWPHRDGASGAPPNHTKCHGEEEHGICMDWIAEAHAPVPELNYVTLLEHPAGGNPFLLLAHQVIPMRLNIAMVAQSDTPEDVEWIARGEHLLTRFCRGPVPGYAEGTHWANMTLDHFRAADMLAVAIELNQRNRGDIPEVDARCRDDAVRARNGASERADWAYLYPERGYPPLYAEGVIPPPPPPSGQDATENLGDRMMRLFSGVSTGGTLAIWMACAVVITILVTAMIVGAWTLVRQRRMRRRGTAQAIYNQMVEDERLVDEGDIALQDLGPYRRRSAYTDNPGAPDSKGIAERSVSLKSIRAEDDSNDSGGSADGNGADKSIREFIGS